jgi:hypothetical protein
MCTNASPANVVINPNSQGGIMENLEVVKVVKKGPKSQWHKIVRRADGTLETLALCVRSKHARIRKGILARICKDKEQAAIRRILLFKETLEQKERSLFEWAFRYGPDHVIRAILDKDPRWAKMARRAYYRQRALAKANKP